MEQIDSEFSLRRILFGSIRKKLNFAFGVLILLLVIIVIITYNLNNQISTDQNYLREVNAPLGLMVEQVIGYDAMLTGAAHVALLHAEKGELKNVEEHKTHYDEIGVKLDNLLKVDAIILINKSRRSETDRQKVYLILNKLDKINLKLVDLELGAFDAMEKGDIEKARNLIVSEQYHEYKNQLSGFYQEWASEEARIAEIYRQRILIDSRNVKIYNVGLGVLFILIASIIPFFITNSIANPIVKLKEATEEIEKKNFKARVDIKSGDELETLGKSFNKTAEALDRMDEEYKKLDSAKTEFLSITSHELRSPMTPMKAQLQMVLGDYFGKITKEQRESLQIVLNNTERLDKIIVDFLEISRIEAARLKFNFIRTDLTMSINRTIEEMKGFMPEKKIKIESEISKLPIIEVDPDRTMQVLRNLINNAIKFTPENGKIIVSAKVNNEMILFSVKDNGIGIKIEDQKKLFEPFYQVDNMYQHKSGGTGLGLAISRGIIESQNGRIWIESQFGKGTIFYFTIPLKPIRNIKAIKLLFSSSQEKDEKIKNIFREILGPLGEKEFNNLEKSQGINEKSIMEYIILMKNKKILDLQQAEEFKSKINLVLGNLKEEKKEKKGIVAEDISEFIK